MFSFRPLVLYHQPTHQPASQPVIDPGALFPLPPIPRLNLPFSPSRILSLEGERISSFPEAGGSGGRRAHRANSSQLGSFSAAGGKDDAFLRKIPFVDESSSVGWLRRNHHQYTLNTPSFQSCFLGPSRSSVEEDRVSFGFCGGCSSSMGFFEQRSRVSPRGPSFPEDYPVARQTPS